MMIKSLLVVLTLFLLGCSSEFEEREGFRLTVHIAGDYDDYLYIFLEEKDSAKVENGVAVFTGVVDVPQQVGVILHGRSNVAWVFLENSDIDMYCSYRPGEENVHHKLKVDSVVGSKSEDLLSDWFKDLRAVQENRESSISMNTRVFNLVERKIE